MNGIDGFKEREPWKHYDHEDPPIVATCEECSCKLRQGDEVLKADEEYFCSSDCVDAFFGITEVYL